MTDYFIYTKDYISEPVQLSTEPAGTETAQIPIKTTSQDISLPVSPGMYEIVLRQKNNQILQRALAIVSNANIIVRQDGDQVLFSSFTPEGLIDRTPLTLTAYSSRQRLTSLKTFTVTGTSTSDFPLSSPIDFFFGDIDGHTVFIPMQLPQSTADINARTPDQTPYRIFLTTDRPLYKPGDTVFYRGIARRDTDGLYAPLDSNTIIDVTFMYAVDGKQETLRQQVTTDAQGIFHNFFTIPTTILQGLREEYPQTYNLTASIKQAPRDPYDFDGTAFFQVQNFTKPTVLLTTTATDESIMWNKSVSYTISATTVDGKPLPNKKLYYQLYHDNLYETTKKAFSKSFNITAGGMCGGGFSLWNDYWGTELGSTRSTITTNEQGQATITFTPKESSIIPEYSKRITLLASVFDDQLTEIYSAKTVTAYRSTYVLNFAPSSQVQRPGTPLSIPFLVETLEGQPIQPPITATLKKSENSKDNTPLSVSYSQPGVGLATLASTNDLQPGSYYVELATTDDAGRAITSSRYIQIYESESENQRNNGVNYVTVTSPNTTYLVGETISLTFQSPTHIQALLTAERGEMYFTKEIDLPQGESTIDIPVDSSFTPSVTIVLSYMVNGKYYTHGIPINIPAMHKLLNVSVTTDKTTYTPGDTAQTTIHVTDAKGNPVQTAVSLAVVDQAIFALRKSAAQPIHSSFYFFRPRTTNASSSRNQLWDYGGRGGGGGGSNGPGSLVDTLYWNPTLTTGADGTAHVAIPLGTAKTTWNFQVYASDVLTNVGQESELIQVQ